MADDNHEYRWVGVITVALAILAFFGVNNWKQLQSALNPSPTPTAAYSPVLVSVPTATPTVPDPPYTEPATATPFPTPTPPPVPSPTPTPSDTPCTALYCGEAQFIRTSFDWGGSACGTDNCSVNATFQNDGSIAGSATVTFTITGLQYGKLVYTNLAQCSDAIPETPPGGVASVSCTAYSQGIKNFSTYPGVQFGVTIKAS